MTSSVGISFSIFRAEGKKYEKALEWKLPIVNIAWLNDILLGDLTPLKIPINEKYTKLPLSETQQQLDVTRVGNLLGEGMPFLFIHLCI